jgi:Zn-dependent protease with chaperone function
MNDMDHAYPSLSATEIGLGAVAEIVRSLSVAARVSPPQLEMTANRRLIARVVLRGNTPTLLVRNELTRVAPPVLRGVMAHEIAHVARRDPFVRRRMMLAWTIAVLLIGIASFGLGVKLIYDGPPWTWALALVADLAAIAGVRAVQLATLRRQEYEADLLAARLAGSPDHVVASLDWMATQVRFQRQPFPLNLWNATHPSIAARRRAVLRASSPIPRQIS